MTGRTPCPECAAPVDAVRWSPRPTTARPRPQLAAVYPCGCWITPAAALELRARRQNGGPADGGA